MKLAENLIQFIGLSDLTKLQRLAVSSLALEYHEKIQRSVDKPTSLTVHVKQHQKDGARKKFSIHVKTKAARRTLESDQADWDLKRACHKAFKNIERRTLHMFRVDAQGKNTKARVGKSRDTRMARSLRGSKTVVKR